MRKDRIRIGFLDDECLICKKGLGRNLLDLGVTEDALWRYSPETAQETGLDEPDWL